MARPPDRSLELPYRSIQHVYFDDLDALNILHNVRYLVFMERARGELFNALGFRWEDDLTVNPDKYHVVAAHQIRYVKPVRGERDLAVEIAPTHLGKTSLILTATVQSVVQAEGNSPVIYAEGETRLVRLDPSTDRPCPWSHTFRERVASLMASTQT